MSTLRIALFASLGLMLLSGSIFALSEALRSSQTTASRISEPVERIVVRADSGDIRIRAGLTADIAVERTDAWLVDKPKVSQTVRDGVLTIESTCDGLGFFFRCETDVNISAPPGVDVEIESRAGDVDLRGMKGRVRIATGAGDIETHRLEPVTIETSTDAGDVSLDLFGEPVRSLASSEAGDVSIVVPYGTYRIEAQADSGSVKVDGVLRDDLAPQRIEAAADAGDVSVSAR